MKSLANILKIFPKKKFSFSMKKSNLLFKLNLLSIKLFSQNTIIKNDDNEIEKVLCKIESNEKIFEFFNIYYETMPEDDLVKLIQHFKKKFTIHEISEMKQIRTFLRNIFEISENVKNINNLSIIIDFCIDTIPLDSNNFIIALDKLIKNNFEVLLRNNMKILTKYYSHLTTDVEKYYEVTWEIISSTLDKYLSSNSFYDLIHILHHYLISLKINDKIFQQITSLIVEKSKESDSFKLKENSDDLNAIIKLYYVMRTYYEQFSIKQEDTKTLSFNNENLSGMKVIYNLMGKILEENSIDVNSLFEKMIIDEKIINDQFEKQIKDELEKRELSRMMNKNSKNI